VEGISITRRITKRGKNIGDHRDSRGPTGHDADLWQDKLAYPINLLTQRGAFILRPNYHGSGNYGLKWVESICCGKYYDLETPDIQCRRGLSDRERIC